MEYTDETYNIAEAQAELRDELIKRKVRNWDLIGENQRTEEQFLTILDCCINGNYGDAQERRERYSFSSQDLKNKLEEYHEENYTDWEQRYEDLDMITSI